MEIRVAYGMFTDAETGAVLEGTQEQTAQFWIGCMAMKAFLSALSAN